MQHTNDDGKTMYEYLLERTGPFKERAALSFYGQTCSYSVLFERIAQTERALRACGVSAGDVIAVSLPGIPEAVYLICAINKIGAVYCAFDCRCKEAEIHEMLKTFCPRLCIIPNFQMKSFRRVYSTPIIHIAPTHSLGPRCSIGTWFANLFTGRSFLSRQHKNFFSYKIFLKHEKHGINLLPQRNRDNIFGYFYTSGTTYGRKSIILSNGNVIAAMAQALDILQPSGKPQTMLNFMPMFACYGVTVGTLIPLSLGISVNLYPLLNPKHLKTLLLKIKPSFVLGVPAHWEHFAKSRFKGCDLSFLDRIIVGGDRMDPAIIQRLEHIFKACASDAWICKGYGMSETTACGTVSERYTPIESVGKHLSQTQIGIFDPDTGRPVSTGEPGEICFCGSAVCCGYYGDDAMTQKLLQTHEDGKIWLHSGDLGYMDVEGNLFFCERLKRMYVRFDGTKVSPFGIEQVLLTCPVIARCMVVPIQDKTHSHGKCAQALVVLHKSTNRQKALREINRFIHEKLAEHMRPQEVLVVKKLLVTKNGKLDYFSTIGTK